ncbi:hypothetical protein GH714_010937 [Hevea brasiliensis]|uniref:B box-type domain-containing protein n=1 Tax=Hevea brasiliensis TaxID=3981 RepID=A0A6A6LFL7_HEVBR|nr:hypothetical protein GH714_010937 [Hevea brasiliensis]
MKIQCDVCERAPATVICCADEAALCAKCDIEVHAANKLASKHQRLLLHAFPTSCLVVTYAKKRQLSFSVLKTEPFSARTVMNQSIQLKEHLEFGEFQWLADVGLFSEQLPQEAPAAAEVPQLTVPPSVNVTSYRASKSNMPNKKPRIEVCNEDEEFFTVPDLG